MNNSSYIQGGWGNFKQDFFEAVQKEQESMICKIINMENLEEFNKAFAEYKGKVLTLMSATTKFKENILIDIENHPDYIDYNLLKNPSNSSKSNTNTKSNNCKPSSKKKK